MFPKILHKRTGKAKKCLFEDIDIYLYEKEARMITFFTNVERIHPWIKTLDLFYYDHMGNNDKFDIKWYDVPTTWSDPNNNNNSIVIEILDKEQALQFNITFFVTTGTIRVQGSKFMTFVHSHFPVLTQILAKVIDNATHATVEEQFDLDQTLKDVNDNTISSKLDDSITSIKSTVHQDVHERTNTPTVTCSKSENTNLVDHFCRIEKTITEAIMQTASQQSNDYTKLITAITTSCETLTTIIKANPRAKDQSEVTSLQKTISTLRDRLLHLENQLKIQDGNIQIERSNNEVNIKSLQSLLDETRKQLKQSCETSQYEFNQYTEKVKAKDEEIQQLTQNIRKLKTNLDTAQDEVIQLKNHIAAQLDANMAKETSSNKAATNQQQHRNDTQSKPKVLFLGTSNIKAINEAKLTTAATVEKVVKYTLKETVAYVTSHEDRPDLVVLHSLTNDLKHLTPQQCIDELDQLISLIHDKWSLAKIVISLTTPRKDDIGFFTNGQIINALVKQSVIGNEVTSVTYCEHSNMLLQGNPINELLADDKFHLSTKGVSILASNIKKAIHWALDIPMPTQQRGRSQSKGPREKDIASYQKQGNILLCGDFNARVASDTDFIIDDSNNLSPLYQSYFSDKQILERRSKDDKLDSRGRDLLDLCISNQIRILNGRVLGDTFGGLTCYTPNGASTVDYVLVSESILNQILYMRICNFIPTLSDCHCLLEWSLSAKYCLKTDCDSVNTHKMSPGFIWSDDSPALFQDALFTAEIQQRLEKFLKLEPINSQNAIDSASLELTDIIKTAANISLKRRKAQTGKGVKHQKWFDCNLAYLRKNLFSYGKIYSRFPRDPAVKGHFYKLQRLYTKARKHKYREYKQSLLKQIETLHEENPKQYWQLIDELQGKEKDDKSALVAPFDWLNHFKNLTEPKDEFKERLQFLEEKLNILEKRKCFNELDSRISETEISTALSSLKINKAAGLDNISNNNHDNGPESFHSHYNEQFYSTHPTIYTFVEIILQVQATTYIKIRGSNNQALVKRTDKEKIQFTVQQFLKFQTGEISRQCYLKSLGYKYQARTDL
ncbi:unnamed protein product [Mytilus edulis]|uniref:Endonuclease/exonuclease/phosphatase domain-containing protein n=1 Tax=Mytilus edulis TaxID=6550 RepID=A0A8S3SJX3_MYTED|nr:unnamed protein product [Mytilus edulis]